MHKLQIKKIKFSDLKRNRYIEIFNSSEKSTPFHSLDWLEFIAESNLNLSLELVVVLDGCNEIAYLPYFTKKNWPSYWMYLPYGTYSGFIYKEINETKIFEFLRKKRFVNFISRLVILDGEKYKNLPYLYGVYDKYVTWILETTNPYNDILDAIPSKTRNQIRKAFKEGVTYKKIETVDELESCKNLYSMLVRKHNISSPYPYKLFEKLFWFSKKGGDISFNVATHAEQVIAYSVFIMSRTQVFYWLNASNPEYSSLNATNGILSLMIKSCCENSDVKVFNFGAVPYGNDGLMHFKKNWGAIERKYGYYNSFIKRLKEKFDGIMGR